MSYAVPNELNNSCIREIPEKYIVNRWLSFTSGTRLHDTNGNPVIIVNPGKLNAYDGPDIQNVLVYYNGEFVQGDIECHRSPSEWFIHGHEKNNNYESVIMHVVGRYSPRGKQPKLPHIVLQPYEKNVDCLIGQTQINSQTLMKAILQLSDKRWNSFISNYENDDSIVSLMQSACTIFGTKGNELAFGLLWNEIDIEVYFSLSNDEKLDYVLALSNALPIEWRSAGIRPFARHEKRIPLFVKFIDLVYSFDWKNDRVESIALVVKKTLPHGLATEILGNCILPFYVSQLLARNQLNMILDVKRIWESLTLPYVYGKIDTQFSTCIDRRELNKFWVLQGLIELQNCYCHQNMCWVCPVNR